MASAAAVGALRVDLGMNTAAFEAGIAKAEAGLAGFGRAAAGAGAAATKLAEDAQRAARLASMNARQLSFQLIDIAQSIPLAFQSPTYALQNFGFQIAQIGQLYMGQGGMRAALTDAVSMVGRFALRLGPLAVAAGAVTGVFAGMAHEINKTAEVQVSFGDVFQASVQLAAESINTMLAPAISQISVWLQQAWSFSAPIIKGIGNTLISTFIGAFDAAKVAWGAMPGVMGEIAYNVANNVISGIETLIRGAIQLLNGFIDLANQIPGMSLAKLGDQIELGGNENPFAGSMSGTAQGVVDAFSGAFNIDYLGQAFDAIAEKAQGIAKARQETDALTGSLGKAADAASKVGKNIGDSMTMSADKMWTFAGEASGLLGKIFEDSKEVAIAQAVLSAGEGIARTMGSYPFPWNIGMAALHAGAAIAQIAKIASTTKDSKSLPGGVPSASAPVSSPAAAAPTHAVNVTLQGTSFGRDQIRDLLEQIGDVLGDGATLNVSTP